MGRYAEFYRRSLLEKEAFWAEAAESVHWIENGTLFSTLVSRRSLGGSSAAN